MVQNAQAGYSLRQQKRERLGLQLQIKCTVGFVNWPLPSYGSVPLVKDATDRLKQKLAASVPP